MSSRDSALHEEWDRADEQLQFWVGAHQKALEYADGDEKDPAVRFAQAKRDKARANYDAVMRRLSPSEGR